MSRIIVEKSFSREARALRRSFDERFADPHRATAGRFVWDYWNVPEQYTLLRTPAYDFFPKKAYEGFHRRLVLWGREVLGCHDISPPWLSCYVDGCEQKFHGDLPHGPFAFVYSLTRWSERRFRGGETLLMKEPILDYWKSREQFRGLEEGDILERVPARFNQLLVFDPRIPHGVSRVEGARDVREGRLVIHGWFVQPRPFIRGALSPKGLHSLIDRVTSGLEALFHDGHAVSGIMSLRFDVPASGALARPRILANTLRSADAESPRAVLSNVRASLRGFRFGKQKGSSVVTLPLVFE